ERRDDAHRSQRMPLLEHAVTGTLAGHRQAVELPRETDGEIADVDHLLDFSESLAADLSRLERDEQSQVLFGLAQLPGQWPDDFPRLRRRHRSPAQKTVPGALDHPLIVSQRGGDDTSQRLAVGGVLRRDLPAPRTLDPPAVADPAGDRLDSQALQNIRE